VWNRQRLGLLLAGLLLALWPGGTLAADLRTGENIVIGPNEVIDDDLYAFGQRIDVRGRVTGDVVAAGQTVSVSGAVGRSATVAGQTVDVSGPVTGSVRAAGQSVAVAGQVQGDALLAGASANVQRAASVGRDVLLGAANASLDGPIGRRLLAGAETLSISNRVGGDARAEVGSLRLEDGALIQGSLNYISRQEASIAPGARVVGQVSRSEPHRDERERPADPVADRIGDWIRGLIGISVFGLLLLLLVPRAVIRAAITVGSDPLPSFGIGLATILLVPLAALLTFIIGLFVGLWWLGLLAMAAYVLLFPVGLVASALWLGRRLFDVTRRRGHVLVEFLIGVLLLSLIGIVPILGGLVLAIATVVGIGAVLLSLWRRRRETRSTAAPVPATPPPAPSPAPA
jgi:cytoskeletal protein CcmA (bactofilin family)